MPTKAELEQAVKLMKEEIRTLRRELREAKNAAKTADDVKKDLTYNAYGVILDEDNFKLVDIKFDKKTGAAAVVGEETIGGRRKDYSRLIYYCKKKMADICKEVF